MKKMLAAVVLGLALAIPGVALAATGMSGSDVTLAKGDNRTGTFYAGAQTVTIDGNVDGDLICGGQTVVVNGSVNGDVICAGQAVTINGAVTGSVRVAGQVVTVNNSVGRNLTVGAQRFTLGSAAHVAGDAALGGQTIALKGPIDRDTVAALGDLELSSTIGGSLNYVSQNQLAIDHSKVKGPVIYQAPPQTHHRSDVAKRVWSLLFWIASGLIVTLVAIWIAPRLVRGVTATMIARPSASVGWGALTLIAGPAVLFILALTVIGMPLGLLLGAIWFMAIVTSGLFAGVAVGQLALGRKDAGRKHLAMVGLAGVPLVLILGWLPYIGFLVSIGTTAWAVGAMVLALNKARTLG